MEKGNRLYHKLDRYIGIPSVLLLGLLRNRFRKAPEKIDKIAIINLFSIGDNVLMSAVIKDLSSAYPHAEITAFTASNNYQLAKLIPGFHNVIKLPITSPLTAIKLLKSAGKFDIVLDFGAWPRISAIYTFFTKARYKVGFHSPGQFRHYCFDKKIKYLETIHEIDNYRNLIRPFYTGQHHAPHIKYVPSGKSNELIRRAGKYCIIHPWPGGYKSHLKQWDNKNWIELIHRIDQYFDTIILTGAPGDNEKCAEFEDQIDKTSLQARFLNISGQFNLGETAHILHEAQFVISIDTGIAHMAAAFNKPTISIQGPASSIRWRPYSPNAVAVNPDKGTFGYLSFGYEYYRAKENCMENISVDSVYNAFMKKQQLVH